MREKTEWYNMETISKLPDRKGTIGTRQIAIAVKSGKIKRVIVANNCPDFLIEKVKSAVLQRFDGDQKELGTKLGKPFPVAAVGYEE